MFSEEDLSSVVGRTFPGGSYTIHPWRAWLLADAVLAEPPALQEPEQVAHPLFAWMAATGAMGLTWDELFAWFGASASDGPVFGEHETALHRQLKVGATYRVTGRIDSATRKVGRRTGTFDVVGYSMDLYDAVDAAPVAACWNSIVFPRRDA